MKLNRLTWGLLAAGILLRLLLWVFQTEPESDDGLRYLTESINLVDHGTFSSEPSPGNNMPPPPTAHDLPLWPGIMALFYAMTGSVTATQYLAGFTNIILSATGALLLCSMLADKPFRFGGRQIAAACGVYLFMPETVVYSLCHMPDQLAVTAVIAALRFYFKGVFGRRRYLAGSVLFFLAAIYAKPVCIPLAAALLAALLLILDCPWRKRAVIVLACALALLAGLYPWTLRNRAAFGTAGLTTISGTNLYKFNWGLLVNTLPEEEKNAEIKAMEEFEESIANDDLMLQSRKQGDYAKKRLLSHLPRYALFSLKSHPRLYAGTGTVALLRYLGLWRIFDCLDAMWGSGVSRGYVVHNTVPYTAAEKAAGASVQIVSWIILLACYIAVFAGIIRGWRSSMAAGADRLRTWLVYLCPVLCLILLAAVIGPVVATRYRFIMIPFFAMIAARAFPPKP